MRLLLLVMTAVFGAVLGLAGVKAQPDAMLVVGDDDLSAYSTAWHAILEEAGIRAQYITVQQEQRRRLFVAGRMVADCCTIPEWRQRPEEVAVQLYTDPFFYAVDHIVVRADDPSPPKKRSDLRTRRVATVHGFDYIDPENLGPRVETGSMEEALAAVADGRADAVIVNLQEYMRQQRRHHWALQVGIEYSRVDLRARVHKSHADLLPRLNAAIRHLRKSGRIEALVGAAIRGRERGGHTVPHPRR